MSSFISSSDFPLHAIKNTHSNIVISRIKPIITEIIIHFLICFRLASSATAFLLRCREDFLALTADELAMSFLKSSNFFLELGVLAKFLPKKDNNLFNLLLGESSSSDENPEFVDSNKLCDDSKSLSSVYD